MYPYMHERWISCFSREPYFPILFEDDGGVKNEWVCQKDPETNSSHHSSEAIRKKVTDSGHDWRRLEGRVFEPEETDLQTWQTQAQAREEVYPPLPPIRCIMKKAIALLK